MPVAKVFHVALGKWWSSKLLLTINLTSLRILKRRKFS